MTWLEIKRVLDGMTAEQLDRQAQVWVHEPDHPDLVPLQPVVTFETVGQLSSCVDDDGNASDEEGARTRSSYDNEHHPEDFVLLTDCNLFDERGNLYHTLTEDGWVGNADGEVDPEFLGGWIPGQEGDA